MQQHFVTPFLHQERDEVMVWVAVDFGHGFHAMPPYGIAAAYGVTD
jgi:hypothetical protein